MNRYIDRTKTIYVKDSTSASIDTTKVVASKNYVEDTKITKKEDTTSEIIIKLIVIASGVLLISISTKKL